MAQFRSAVRCDAGGEQKIKPFDRGRYAGIQTHPDLLALAVGIRNRLVQRLSTRPVVAIVAGALV